MSRIRACLTSCLVAGGIVCVPMFASAQDFENAGIVQISDSTSSIQPAGASCPDGNCPNGYSSGTYCPPGGYGHGHGHDGYRFSPPVKRPIYRTPVSYNKMFPDAWTGQNAYGQQPAYRAPMVYMPTDTTQLGYYYQSVPYWQPRPGAVPPPPVPSQWHTTVGQMNYQGHHPAGIIYGTAPTAVPNQPAPAPWDGQGLPPEPTPASITTTQGMAESSNLERTASSPTLLPIE